MLEEDRKIKRMNRNKLTKGLEERKIFQVQEAVPLENHSLNCSWLSNKVGMIKWSRAHNSAMLFCIGVPVRSKQFLQLKLSKVFHRMLQHNQMMNNIKLMGLA
jgi:hypothetical protein